MMRRFHGINVMTALFFSASMLVCCAGAGERATGNGFSRFASAPSPTAAQPPVRTASQPAASTSVSTSGPAGQAAGENLVFPASNRERGPAGERREYRAPSIFPAMLSVAAVCGLFLVALYLIKKYLPGHRQLFSHPAMEVLGRTHLDQRRYVSLLRVGKRIVVVGVSPDEMRPLSEITDEDEITAIMEVARPKTEAGLTVFQRLFQRNVVEAEKEEDRVMAAAKAEQLDEQMSSLRNRVREIGGRDKPKDPGTRKLDRIG